MRPICQALAPLLGSPAESYIIKHQGRPDEKIEKAAVPASVVVHVHVSDGSSIVGVLADVKDDLVSVENGADVFIIPAEAICVVQIRKTS